MNMAAKFRKIDPRIWTDEKFQSLDLEGRILAFWLLTSDRVNRCGIVSWSPGLASEETGIDRQRVDTVYHTVCDTLFWVYDKQAKLVFLSRWWRYNQPSNIDAMKGALEDLKDLPRNSLKHCLLKACEELKPDFHTVYIRVLDMVYDRVSPTVSAQEKEKEKEKEKENYKNITPPPADVVTEKPPTKKSLRETNPNHQPAIDHFTAEWNRSFRDTYPFAQKDAKAVQRILKAIGNDLDKFKRIVGRYFTNNESFYAGHSLTKLESSLPAFIAETPKANYDLVPGVNC